MANQRKGVIEIEASNAKPEFAVASVKSFRMKMMEEEKKSGQDDMKN